ncbi:MAG: S-adenosylmethionine:tRNA ribosyltransferase-isomerase, partial [Lentisphaeria bacterium]
MTIIPISDYDFFLPKELIAQQPLADRSSSKMLVINSKTGEMHSTFFRNIVNYIQPNDTLVFNNTKVIPARIFGNKVLDDASLGANIEALLID